MYLLSVLLLKDVIKNKALTDSSNKVNAMILAYALKLAFKIRQTNIRA